MPCSSISISTHFPSFLYFLFVFIFTSSHSLSSFCLYTLLPDFLSLTMCRRKWEKASVSLASRNPSMASRISERVELAKLCSSKNWSKAIRILDSLLARSPSVQDLWFVFSRFDDSFFDCFWLISIDSDEFVFSLIFQKISNRAFCYSQLELHKHVIKDCDRALELDPGVIQAYILKGASFVCINSVSNCLN